MSNPFECRFAVPKSDIAGALSAILLKCSLDGATLGNPRVPSLHSDAAFVLKMTQRCCFSVATVLAGLDYFVRLIDKGLVIVVVFEMYKPDAFPAGPLASHILEVVVGVLHAAGGEDVGGQLCTSGEDLASVVSAKSSCQAHIMGQYSASAHTKREYLQLQMGILKVLNWDMNITLKRLVLSRP